MASRTLLIPSFLDDHFPLLRRAFASARWQPVLLTQDQGLAEVENPSEMLLSGRPDDAPAPASPA